MLYNQIDKKNIKLCRLHSELIWKKTKKKKKRKIEQNKLIDTNEEVVVDEQPVVQEEPVEEAKTSKIDQKVTKKDILISLGIILGVLVLTIIVILSCVFGIATTKAKEVPPAAEPPGLQLW